MKGKIVNKKKVNVNYKNKSEYQYKYITEGREVKNLFYLSEQRYVYEQFFYAKGFKSLDDFYTVSWRELSYFPRGGSILNLYKGSIYASLTKIFPNYCWNVFEFQTKPRNFWTSLENQRNFLDYIIKKNNLSGIQDFFKLNCQQFVEIGGNSLLKYYKGSLDILLKKHYPEIIIPGTIREQKFPRHFWDNLENQRKFLDEIARIYNITDVRGWYDISIDTISSHNGRGLINKYSGNLYKLLTVNYPEYNFNIFLTSSTRKFQSVEKRKLIEILIKKFSIRKLDDWYRISVDQLYKIESGSIIYTNGGLFTLLKNFFIEEKWSFSSFKQKLKKSKQRWLIICLESFFPQCLIIEEYFHPFLRFSASGIYFNN